jgi:hypothetical protein
MFNCLKLIVCWTGFWRVQKRIGGIENLILLVRIGVEIRRKSGNKVYTYYHGEVERKES